MQRIEKPGDNSKKPTGSRSVYIATYGCQMNVRDSEVVRGILEKEGFKFTDKPEKADIVLLNTCSVRQHAEEKVWSEVGRIVKSRTECRVRSTGQKRHGTPYSVHAPIIGIIGCMAQSYKESIFDRCPEVSLVVGPQDIAKIPGIIKKLSQGTGSKAQVNLFERKIWETDGQERPEEIYHTAFYEDKNHAYVIISEGCSNYCSYCVVPYARGQLKHRNHEEILKEIEGAVKKGITHITLLGQNVNSYKHGDVDFIKLLILVNSVENLKEFSFVTSHPKDTSIDLFKKMQELEKLKKCLHLPLQSGSDRILKLMNRGYSAEFYLNLADEYRKIVKNGKLSTDIIVGFPTENEAEFKHTLNLVKKIDFDAAYIFKYSPRPHTEAARMPDDVPKEEKEKRHRLILDLQREISKRKKC